MTGKGRSCARQKGSRSALEKAGAWKPAKTKAGFHRLPHSLGNLAKGTRFPLSQRADDGERGDNRKTQRQGGGLTAGLYMAKRTNSKLIKPDILTS
jgi:hypothetical protein